MTNEREFRRGARVSIEIPAHFVVSDGTEIPVIVEDVSSGGFRLRTDELLVPGERARLRVEHGQTYQVEIQWSSRSEAGGRFLEPVEIVNGIPR